MGNVSTFLLFIVCVRLSPYKLEMTPYSPLSITKVLLECFFLVMAINVPCVVGSQQAFVLPETNTFVEMAEAQQVGVGKCHKFTPTFCDMVDWEVATAKLDLIENTELMIEMSFYNQPGTWACRKEFKEFQCRIMFPKCDQVTRVKPPCKKSCQEFANRCPGSDVACDDLTNDKDQCYTFDFSAQEQKNGKRGKPSASLKGWPSALIGGFILSVFLGASYAADRKKRANTGDSNDMEVGSLDPLLSTDDTEL